MRTEYCKRKNSVLARVVKIYKYVKGSSVRSRIRFYKAELLERLRRLLPLARDERDTKLFMEHGRENTHFRCSPLVQFDGALRHLGFFIKRGGILFENSL